MGSRSDKDSQVEGQAASREAGRWDLVRRVALLPTSPCFLSSPEVQSEADLAFLRSRFNGAAGWMCHLRDTFPSRLHDWGKSLAVEAARLTVIPMKTISFKVRDDEARRIRQLAKSEGVSVSEFLRRRAIGSEVPQPVGRVRCDLTGAEIFAPLTDSPPLTTEEVRRILADFP
jgi:hypothetical protein